MIAPLEFHVRLVEEAVWAAILGHREAGKFHRERETPYAATDPEARERLFARFYFAWFDRLDLAGPIAAALQEQETALAPARRILFGPATTEKREGAELFVAGPGEFSVVVTLRPQILVDRRACLTLLRRELLHIADMLDPAFAYEPRLPPSEVGPAHDRRLQDRYRVLWNCSVDGRLVRLGRIDPAARDDRLREFGRAFATLADAAGGCFDRLFSGPRPTHPELVEIAADPQAGFGLCPSRASSAGRCPLCGFPTVDLEPDPSLLPPDALRALASEFPAWRPELGICPQCADLYRSRRLVEVPSR
jgi:hypothetical protein